MLSVLTLILMTTAAAPTSTIAVTPVRGSLDPELTIDIEESARDALLEHAKKYGLMVMRHQTMAKRMAALTPPHSPCSSVECDLELATKLKTDYLVSMKAMKIDGEYIVILKILRTLPAKQISTNTIRTSVFGDLLTRVYSTTTKMMTESLIPQRDKKQMGPVIQQTTMRVYRNKLSFGVLFNCTLYNTRLDCKQGGLSFFASKKSKKKVMHVPFSKVSSIFDDDEGFGLQLNSGKKYFFRIAAPVGQNKTDFELEMERSRRQESLRTFQHNFKQALELYNKTR